MGSMMQKTMDQNAKNMQKAQIEMMLKQRQTQMAIQMSQGKDLFHWFSAFYFTIFPLCIIGAIKKKNPTPIIPLIPLGFVFAYQYDMFYGNKMDRIKREADRLISQEPERFYFPKNGGIVTQQEYEDILKIKKK